MLSFQFAKSLVELLLWYLDIANGGIEFLTIGEHILEEGYHDGVGGQTLGDEIEVTGWW